MEREESTWWGLGEILREGRHKERRDRREGKERKKRT